MITHKFPRNQRAPRLFKQWEQYSRTRCGCAAAYPFKDVGVGFAGASTRKTHTNIFDHLEVAYGDPPVRDYCPYCLNGPEEPRGGKAAY